MPIDLTALNRALEALIGEATRTQGTEDSAGVLISGFSAAITKAVTDALEADAAANAATIAAATQAIADVTKVFSDADDKLGAAIANPGGPVAGQKK